MSSRDEHWARRRVIWACLTLQSGLSTEGLCNSTGEKASIGALCTNGVGRGSSESTRKVHCDEAKQSKARRVCVSTRGAAAKNKKNRGHRGDVYKTQKHRGGISDFQDLHCSVHRYGIELLLNFVLVLGILTKYEFSYRTTANKYMIAYTLNYQLNVKDKQRPYQAICTWWLQYLRCPWDDNEGNALNCSP